MHSRLAHPIAIRAAYLLRRDNAHPEDKWWFDMEYAGEAIESRDNHVRPHHQEQKKHE
jgi:hypothetical protein